MLKPAYDKSEESTWLVDLDFKGGVNSFDVKYAVSLVTYAYIARSRKHIFIIIRPDDM